MHRCAQKPLIPQFKGWRFAFFPMQPGSLSNTGADAEIHGAFQSLPNEMQADSATQVGKLGELVDSDLPLQSFLEQLLPQLCMLFGGKAAVSWMKAFGNSDAIFGVRYQMDRLLTAVSEQKKHERLVQLAWQQRQPLLAESTTEKTNSQQAAAASDFANPNNSNTTGYPLLFGPILHLGEPIALLEIVLAETSQPLTQSQRQLYLRAVKLVSERVYGGLRRRMAMPAASIDKAVSQLEQLGNEVVSLQHQIRQRIETRLQHFQGWAFASFTQNQAFAKMVHQMLESHGLRVRCPECGHAAILRCLRVGNSKHGAFVYDHYLDTGRTFHGGPSSVPLIQVVPKPARRPAHGTEQPRD